MKKITLFGACAALFVGLTLVATGCRSDDKSANDKPVPASIPAVAVVTAPAMPEKTSTVVTSAAPAVEKVAVRIKAGGSSFKDSSGNVWIEDKGFSGGDTVERSELTITNTPDPQIYRSERYLMDSFSWPLANGKYTVKLHFCETYEGIDGPGQRVFSFNVQGHEFKDFDVWAKAGGPLKPFVQDVPVDIIDGKLLITFTSNIENPQINGIEIIPQL